MDPEHPSNQAPPVVTPVVAPIDPNAIAAAVAQGMAQHQQQLQSAPRQMTPEETAQYLQVFDVTADGFIDNFHAAMTDPEATPDQRKALFERMRDGLVNQSLRGAEIFVDQRIAQLRQEFQPALVAQEQQQAASIWETFSAKHPDLKDHRELVDTVSIQLQASGFKPTSLDDAFSRAAATTRTLLKLPEPVAGAKPTAPNSMPRMNPTNTTPSGGGGPQEAPGSPGVAGFFLSRKK